MFPRPESRTRHFSISAVSKKIRDASTDGVTDSRSLPPTYLFGGSEFPVYTKCFLDRNLDPAIFRFLLCLRRSVTRSTYWRDRQSSPTNVLFSRSCFTKKKKLHCFEKWWVLRTFGLFPDTCTALRIKQFGLGEHRKIRNKYLTTLDNLWFLVGCRLMLG